MTGHGLLKVTRHSPVHAYCLYNTLHKAKLGSPSPARSGVLASSIHADFRGSFISIHHAMQRIREASCSHKGIGWIFFSCLAFSALLL